MGIKKIDIPQSTAIDASVLWGGINDNVLAAKINEVIDAVNELQTPAENVQKDTESRPENVQKETFVSIDEALEMGKQDHKIRSTNERLRKALDLAIDALNKIKTLDDNGNYEIEDYDCQVARITQEALEQINEITKGGDNEIL